MDNAVSVDVRPVRVREELAEAVQSVCVPQHLAAPGHDVKELGVAAALHLAEVKESRGGAQAQGASSRSGYIPNALN